MGVFVPFKSILKVAFNDWHIGHTGKTLTIYYILSLAKLAYLEALTGKNITSGFIKPGIHPLNKLHFSDEDFAPCNTYAGDVISTKRNILKTPLSLPEHNSLSIEPVQPLELRPSTPASSITPETIRQNNERERNVVNPVFTLTPREGTAFRTTQYETKTDTY